MELPNSAAGIATGISDIRAKTDIRPVGTLYEYRYRTDPPDRRRIGVMAQEIKQIRPEAVPVNEDGLKQVDYGLLFGTGGE